MRLVKRETRTVMRNKEGLYLQRDIQAEYERGWRGVEDFKEYPEYHLWKWDELSSKTDSMTPKKIRQSKKLRDFAISGQYDFVEVVISIFEEIEVRG